VSPRRFSRKRGGRLDVTLEPAEAALLRELPDQLRELYQGDDADPARDRLFPRAYLDPTEEQAEEEWRALVYPDLLATRLESLDRLTASLETAEPGRKERVVLHLEPDDVQAWLAVLNDARLALGTRLGVTESAELAAPDPSDPQAATVAAYTWLTYLEGELVEELLGDLPK
jgi:Domain of unknown function (DUF2017)